MKLHSLLCLVLAASLFMPATIFSNTIRPGQPPVTKEAPQNGAEPGNASQPENAPAPESGAQNDDQAVNQLTSIASVGDVRDDIEGEPLVLPTDSDDISKLQGNWNFERSFIDANKQLLNADLNLDENGNGILSYTGKDNIRHEAAVQGSLKDGVLRLRTDKFTSKDSPIVYNSEFIECRNGANGAECTGTDGFGEWNGERLFSNRANTPAASQPAARAAAPVAGKAPEGNYEELSADGPELPPAVMERAEKAAMGKNGPNLGALEGDWRFSQDLARKKDGAGVGLEFHFDGEGKGYSVIRDGSDAEFKANAESILMPDGAIRVKTEAYSNGKQTAYYPTFMECKGKAAEDLNCNVSNGWMRAENGRLISIKSYEKNQEDMAMEEVLPTAPANGSAQAKEDDMSDIFAGVATPVPTPEENASQSSSSTASGTQGASLALPKSGESVSFMQGTWLCKTGLINTSENKPVVVQFTFNKNGKGTGTIREVSGREFRSSAQASYRNGTLRINTSQYNATSGHGAYEKTTIECHNDNGAALCVGKNGNITWKANFFKQR